MYQVGPPPFCKISATCLALLPILLIAMALGALPYRLYRKAFDRPAFVNIMIGMTGVGAFWALHLLGRAILPHNRFELFMFAPPLISSLVLPLAAGAAYLWLSNTVAIGLLCLLLVFWMIYIPYRGGFRSTISTLESRKRRRAPAPSGDADIPTRATILINVLGSLAFCGTVGYFAGGLAGAMKALVISGAILASIAGFIIGSVHALWVYGPLAMHCSDEEAIAIAS